MRILIVGAGPSGLAALKEMREAGFEAWAVDEERRTGKNPLLASAAKEKAVAATGR